jgi:hypothetical protein
MRRFFLLLLFVLAHPADAATLYLCKAYNGSTFWASAHCGQYNALIERMESVADVPFEQQVQQAQGARNRATTAPQAESFERGQYCARLINERRSIEARYSNWQWQPPEVINPDQQRTVAINSALRTNHCSMQ